MATADRSSAAPAFETLVLPDEFQDLEGLLHADLSAVVAMLADRAHQRLWLSRREHLNLQRDLWNGLAGVVSRAVEPLSVESR